MTSRLCSRMIAALLVIAVTQTAVRAANAPPNTVSFRIEDSLFAPQVDEEIAVSINHRPVGVLKIGANKQTDSLAVTVPAAETYHYDLCGHLNTDDLSGKVTLHRIDNGGDFSAVDGHTLVGVNSDSALFYLVDQTPGQPALPPRSITTGRSCVNTVAMR